MNNLQEAIAYDVMAGAIDMSRSLGIVTMPDGYALMLTEECGHFYWLRADSAESAIHWNKWAVYHWAVNDKEKRGAT
jgi:hypothetical protein